MNFAKITNKQRGRSGRSAVTLLAVLGLLTFGWLQRQAIYDWSRLLHYQPPTAIAQLANDATMTPDARHIYYVNHPELKARNSFSNFCNSATEQTVVLGCYKSGQSGIYLLQVDNDELAGIQQVTAAHEMLHAAYDRLSSSERERINGLLTDYYHNHLNDEAIQQTIEDYKKSEPNDLVNEMHSIFGTQIAQLPQPLEDYYSQYFTDRAKVVHYYATYEEAFSSRQQLIKHYDTQLSTWKQQINVAEQSLKQQQSFLEAQRAVLNQQRSRGDGEAYNSGVGKYNAAVSKYNSDLANLQQLIRDYNNLVQTRNAIAFEERQLVTSLSSSTLQLQ